MAPPERRTLDPKLDVVFKLLFANPEAKGSLISLLTAVLNPASPIEDVEVLNPEVVKKEALEKGIVLDIRVRLVGGIQVDVEMQSERRFGSRKRPLYYWAKMYNGQLTLGDEYVTLKPVILVVITDYREIKASRLHSTYRVLEVTHHDELCQDLEIHFVELPELKKMTKAAKQIDPLLASWAKFLAAKTDTEVEEAAMEDAMINQAKDVLERLSADPKVREMASWRESQLAFDHWQRQQEREEAQAEGRAEGRAQEKRDLLCLLLERNSGPLTAEQRRRLAGCDDLSCLDQWVRRAIEGEGAEDLQI